MVLSGGYLLWRGADYPGGAFQGGAVIGAALILMLLQAKIIPPDIPEWSIRLILVVGFLVFLILAGAMLVQSGRLLEYPVTASGALILIIESALTVSIALILAVLFAGRLSGNSPSEKLTQVKEL
jgi:multisubunit Na+/H+ antiporter MnhB subunit